MKNLTISFVALFFAFGVCQGQTQDIKNYASNPEKKEKRIEIRSENKEKRKNEEKTVSANSLKNFKKDFGVISLVSWVRTDHYDEASFINNDQKTKAYYDFEGNLVGTAIDKSLTDLPIKGQKSIEKEYSGYSVEFVILYDFNKLSDAQMILYNDQLSYPKNYFVQMSNGKERIVLQVTPVGKVYYFKKI